MAKTNKPTIIFIEADTRARNDWAQILADRFPGYQVKAFAGGMDANGEVSNLALKDQLPAAIINTEKLGAASGTAAISPSMTRMSERAAETGALGGKVAPVFVLVGASRKNTIEKDVKKIKGQKKIHYFTFEDGRDTAEVRGQFNTMVEAVAKAIGAPSVEEPPKDPVLEDKRGQGKGGGRGRGESGPPRTRLEREKGTQKSSGD